jgi:hypothetical protein
MYDMYPFPDAVTQQGCQEQLTQLEQQAASNGVAEFTSANRTPEQGRIQASFQSERLGFQIGSRLVERSQEPGQGNSNASV